MRIKFQDKPDSDHLVLSIKEAKYLKRFKNYKNYLKFSILLNVLFIVKIFFNNLL